MKVTKKPNLSKYKKTVDNLSGSKSLGVAVNETIVSMRKRTEAGLDVNNSAFKPYAEATKTFKQKTGRSSTIVNLTQTGQMLGSITAKGISGGIRLYFNSREDNTKAYNNQVKLGRKFFAISKKQKAVILDILKKYYKNNTK